MHTFVRSVGAPLLLCLASCGGGGGGGGGGGPAVFTLSGSIDVIDDSLADSDVNDPLTTRISNNNSGEQQTVPNPVTLGGYANRPGAGPAGPSFAGGDEFDGYSVPLGQGQNVNLYIAEPSSGDLDLFLLDAGQVIVDSSEGIGQDETVTAPSAGDYTVLVYAFGGASNYVLQIGAGPAAAMHGMRYSADFVTGDAMVRFIESKAASGPDMTLQSRAAALGLSPRGGARGRAMLFGLPAAGIPDRVRAADPGRDGWHRHLAHFDAKRMTLRAIKGLAGRADVQFAEPNLMRRPLAEPTDSLFAQQWHYALINLPLAWDITQGSADVVVAVVDTGVVLAHPDLAGQFDPQDPSGVDFIVNAASARDGDGRDQNADDPGDGSLAGSSSFHGTHVAGTIAAATNNGGVAGGAWNARIMPLRVLGEGGGSSFDIQQAVLYAAGLPNDTGIVPANPADVINLSLGGGGASAAEQQVYTDVINAGVLVAAAAGNNNSSELSYPASYTGVVSVAAVGPTKGRAPYSQFNSAVDVAAPGGDMSASSRDGVLSTHATDSSGAVVSNFAYLQGTSMATPHIAAVMALMRSVHPALTQQDFIDLLVSGAITEDLGAAGRDNTFGYGLIDARRAVAAAADLAGGAPPVVAPVLAVGNDSLQFGSSLQTLYFDLRNAGDGTLEVTSVGDDQPWLSVTADDVAADGTGRYRASVSRSGLADGFYQATISATSTANTVQIPVTVQVSSTVAGANAGYTYVLLVDPATFETVAQFDGATGGGSLGYSFGGVGAGSYVVIAGSDQNNDGFICDIGESCGAYPTLDAFETVDVAGAGRAGLNFLSGFSFGVNASSASAGPGGVAPDRRFRRLR